MTTPISFPLEKFNLEFVSSPETLSKEHCVYDLIGLVSHTGGIVILITPFILQFLFFNFSRIFAITLYRAAIFLFALRKYHRHFTEVMYHGFLKYLKK